MLMAININADAVASHWCALLEALKSPGSPPSELPGLFRAPKRATDSSQDVLMRDIDVRYR